MTIVNNPRRPVAVLSYIDSSDTQRLLDAAKKAGLKNAPVYVGNYGVNPSTSAKVHQLANGRYAPMFSLDETSGRYKGRHDLTKAQAKILSTRPDAKYSGAVPKLTQLASLSPTERVKWGMELGRRMRDTMREGAAKGAKSEAWQFDEVLGEAGQSGNTSLRQFTRGVLHGLNVGRPILGDKPKKGITWFAHTALPLAGQPMTAEKRRFWKTVDESSLRVIGEEYPNFTGDPRAAARAWNDGQEMLARSSNKNMRNIARKFMAGLTPGYTLNVGLGGNTAGMSRAAVNHWRDAYIAQRKSDGVAGFAEFSFVNANNSTSVFDDTLRSVAKGVRR